MLRSESEYDYLLKIALVGDQQVGKTSFSQRFTKHEFSESYVPTIGKDFSSRTIDVRDNVRDKTIKFQVWDAEIGRMLQTKIHPQGTHLRGAHGVFIVYDVTSRNSFENAKQYFSIMREFFPDAVFMLIGNKCDLVNKREVDYETAKDFADENDIELLECSAKNATQIEKAFLTLASINLENIEVLKQAEQEAQLRKTREAQAKRLNEVNGTYFRRNTYSIFFTILGSALVGLICTLLYVPLLITLASAIGALLVFNLIVLGVDRDRSRHFSAREDSESEGVINSQYASRHSHEMYRDLGVSPQAVESKNPRQARNGFKSFQIFLTIKSRLTPLFVEPTTTIKELYKIIHSNDPGMRLPLFDEFCKVTHIKFGEKTLRYSDDRTIADLGIKEFSEIHLSPAKNQDDRSSTLSAAGPSLNLGLAR